MAKLSSNLIFSLRWFSMGHTLNICIDICNVFGKIEPSEAIGKIIKLSQIRDLFIRGYLIKELVENRGVNYWHFSVSESGKEYFEEYKNDCSK
jgi:DNA-binding XRE family transcriptional regulator